MSGQGCHHLNTHIGRNIFPSQGENAVASTAVAIRCCYSCSCYCCCGGSGCYDWGERPSHINQPLSPGQSPVNLNKTLIPNLSHASNWREQPCAFCHYLVRCLVSPLKRFAALYGYQARAFSFAFRCR